MGLLTDPHTGQGRIVLFILKFNNLICFLLYIGAIAWFCLLPHAMISLPVHFSENALLPGLVKTDFSQEALAMDYYNELTHEMTKYKETIPYPWLLAKFRQIGLDTYSHNFTFNYPLGKTHTFTGTNIYGILRAARAASTEAIILSAPYRAPSSIHPTNAPAIAIMLAFAKYASSQNYWAKDVIFLVTEHEQLGMQAWLQAYHSKGFDGEGFLNYGDLRGRGGQIQGAINLEMNDLKIGVMDVKIEGINGLLPNLDLVTLTTRMCMKEGLQVTFKNRGNLHSSVDKFRHWKYSLTTMMSMVLSQSTGVPTGNHGLFHRFGIQAVTMHGFQRFNGRGNQVGFYTMGKIIEGLYRSLNNLLERFHQSYFFYLLPSTDRFISIIWYMPILAGFVGVFFVKSLVLWSKVRKDPYAVAAKRVKLKKLGLIMKPQEKSNVFKICIVIFLSHLIGITVMNLPQILSAFGAKYEYNTEVSIFYGFVAISAALLAFPICLRLENRASMVTLLLLMCWELGIALIAIGMLNFSFGIICGTLFAPMLFFINPTQNRVRCNIQRIFWLIYQPFLVMLFVVTVYTFSMFPNTPLGEKVPMAVNAAKQALVFGIVDSLVYGNWIFDVVCCVFLPVWLCVWCIVMSPPYAKMSHLVDVGQDDRDEEIEFVDKIEKKNQ